MRRLHRSADPSCILLREESLGDQDVEIDAEAGSRDRHGQGQRLMPQDPIEAVAIAAQHAVKGPFAEAIDVAVLLLALRPQEFGAHHGRHGQRNQQRHADGDAEHDREFPEEPSDDAPHQQNRNENGHQRRAHGEHGEADFLRAAKRRLHRVHALLDDSG